MRKMLNYFLGSVMLIGLLFPTTVSAAENVAKASKIRE